MSLTSVISSSSSSASSSAISLMSPVGAGVGGIFVAVALIVLLAYFDILSARPDPDPELKQTILVSIVPLLFAFGGVVLFKSLQAI